MASPPRADPSPLLGRIQTFLEWFAPGNIVLALLVMSGIAAVAIFRGSVQQEEATLTFWLFARTHHRFYKEVLPRFEAEHPGVKVRMELSAFRPMHQRLEAAFLSEVGGPDLVEVEIAEIGRYFAGPLESVGFLDLTERVEREGLLDRMVRQRFEPWSSRGHIFGIPHDVHPVALVYNREIFERYGIDVRTIDTWDAFEAAVRPMCVDVDGDGQKEQYAIELRPANDQNYLTLLLQAGGGYFDSFGRVTINDGIAVKVLAKYISWIVGPDRIATGFTDSPGGAVTMKAIIDGFLPSFLCPDWRTAFVIQDAPVMKGKLDACPLPAWRPGGRRTSTWGGTMLGISKRTQHPDLAWEFIKFLYLDAEDLAARYRETAIIPPLSSAWSNPVFHESWRFFSGRIMGELYVELAPHIPAVTVGPFSRPAQLAIQKAIVRAANYCRQNGVEHAEEIARVVLDDAAAEVAHIIDRNPFHRSVLGLAGKADSGKE